MNNLSQAISVKKDILVRIIKAFLSDNFEKEIEKIPYLYSQKTESSDYCCIHKEQAIIKSRIIAGLGFPLEAADKTISLSDYAKQALQRTHINPQNLTVVQTACNGCPSNKIYVTDLCQGCLARPCLASCKFGAIDFKNGRSIINDSKCKKCQMCLKACPYNAIAKTIVPCEEACPVGAIKKDTNGFECIDYKNCIRCGKCIAACPFGVIHEISQVIDVLKAIKADKKVIAMIAPAIAGQFKGSIYQIKTALQKAGFTDVYEVAQGADITAYNEAKEFIETFSQKTNPAQNFMTTSCCAGYKQFVKKHLPEIEPYVSKTHSPVYYSSEIIKKDIPDAVTVFISPCVAKRAEGFDNPNIDYVMNCEELSALFIAKGIDVAECKETAYDVESSKQGRNFCLTGGVAESVKASLKDETFLKSCVINGLNKESIKQLKTCAVTGKCETGCNLVEVMCCEGGCIGGNATIIQQKLAKKQVDDLTAKSNDIKKVDM